MEREKKYQIRQQLNIL